MIWMRLAFVGVLLAMVARDVSAQTQRAAGLSSTMTLAELRDRLRPLLIFAPTAEDSRLLEQVRLVSAHSAEAAERDLVTVAVPERGNLPTGHRLTAGDAIEARKRFHVSAGEFVVVLVGKDGSEKLRSGTPFSFGKLQQTIDAMPMRREEMKAKEH